MSKNCVDGEATMFPADVRTKEANQLATRIKNSVKAKVTEDSMSSQYVHL